MPSNSLLVVTAFAPPRGVLKTQDFIEFRALQTTLGAVIEPLADDVNVELRPDRVIVSRPLGLTLSDLSSDDAAWQRRHAASDVRLRPLDQGSQVVIQ